MMGSFLSRALLMVFGYVYPAYKSFKTVEKNEPEIGQLMFWCQYWILVAVLTVCERAGDTFISWVPMYSEAKLAIFIYLWYPKTKGTTYVYNYFFRPYVAKHETEIDRNLLELRVRAGELAVLYWQKAASYGQTRFFEILQYVSSQSAARPHPTQQQQHNDSDGQPPASIPTNEKSSTIQKHPKQPLSSLNLQQHEPAQEAGHPPTPPMSPTAVMGKRPTVASQFAAEVTSQSTESELEAAQIEPVLSLENGNAKPSAQENIIEEAIRVTRRKLSKIRAAANTK